MSERCPSCHAARVVADPDALAQYLHGERCALALAEQETLAEDEARFRRYGTTSRHRPITQAERLLLGASGVRVPAGEVFTRVTWTDGTRVRTWRRQPVVSITASSP